MSWNERTKVFFIFFFAEIAGKLGKKIRLSFSYVNVGRAKGVNFVEAVPVTFYTAITLSRL